MNVSLFRQPRIRGSALITVVLLTTMLALLTGSMLTYTMTEKRGNERNVVQLRAKNMAENISIYAAEQLSTKLYRTRTTAAMAFMTGSNAISLPDSSGDRSVLSNVKYADVSGMEVRAGIMAPTAYALVTDATDPNFGLQVSTATAPVIAKSTITHPIIGAQTAHVLQEMEIAMTPLFQFGMFYNMDLELYPSQAFTVAGPVHSNGRLIAHPDGSSTIAITFTDRVTAAAGIYWNTAMKAKPRGANGVESLPTEANGSVIFTHTNGTTTADMKGTISGVANKWKDHTYGQTTESATTLANFKSNATTVWNGNVRTNVHGVTKLELPGSGTYSETNLAGTAEDDRNNGRSLIEPPNAKKWNGTTFAATTDDAEAKESKIAWKAGLYIMVNPDDDVTPRSAMLPDGSTAYVMPRSYRAWLHTIDSSFNHTVSEMVLPGQPTYGYNAGSDGTLGTADDYMYRNYLPNRYDATTVGGDGTGNQVLRIPQQGFSSATGYLINNPSGYTLGNTALVLDTGSGPIYAGQTLTIGAHSYLVTGPLTAGTVTIASPGLRAVVVDNTAVTVGSPVNGTGSGYLVNNAAGYAVNSTSITLDTGTGTILPGNTITIGTNKYVAASALVSNVVTLVSPGIRVATVTDNTAFAVDPRDGSLGTGTGYIINNAAGYAAGSTTLAIDTGTGTILPGNLIAIGSRQYVVTTPITSGAITIAAPGLIDAVTDNTPLMVDPFPYSGYSTSIAAPSGAISSGATYPADNIASAPFAYFPADAYFFDLRRANGNRGVVSTSGTSALYDRFTVNYAPRPIAKIDFDLTRLKMMVDRSVNLLQVSTTYDVRAPNAAGVTWANSIFNSAGTAASRGLGMGGSFNVFPDATNNLTKLRQDPFALYYAPANASSSATINTVTGVDGTPLPETYRVPAGDIYDGFGNDAWFDGVAIYLHSVDAEARAQTSGVANRIDSGVRMFNARGNVVSLTATSKTGFTFATNDPVYLIGHFNADGTINATSSSNTDPGGYSARYADNATEKLCAVMGDAVTIVSQPLWTDNASGQVNGWNDALSALPVVASSTNWRTGASTTSTLNGNDDGVITGVNGPRVGLLPNRSYPGVIGTAKSIKLPAVSTEISTALLCGIVPSNHNATGLTDNPPFSGANGVNSGGANNFPRLLDSWSGLGLYIRGSIVALFESRVAMEPFTNSRVYRAPGRYWGLHQGFRTANHDVPLEPTVIGCSRRRYMELTAAEYATKKAEIEALPH